MTGRWSSLLAGWLKLCVAITLPLVPTTAAACPLCYEAVRQLATICQQLDTADRVVLAAPIAGGNRFRFVEVIKGEGAIGDIIADPVTDLDAAAAPGGDPYLLVREPLASQWSSLGTIQAEYADWLRQLVATFLVKGDRPRPTWPSNMQTSSTLSYNGWRQRIALVLPYLENSDPTSKTPTRWLPRSHGASWHALLTRLWTLRDRGSTQRQWRAGWAIRSSCPATLPILSCWASPVVPTMRRASSGALKRLGMRMIARTSPR